MICAPEHNPGNSELDNTNFTCLPWKPRGLDLPSSVGSLDLCSCKAIHHPPTVSFSQIAWDLLLDIQTSHCYRCSSTVPAYQQYHLHQNPHNSALGNPGFVSTTLSSTYHWKVFTYVQIKGTCSNTAAPHPLKTNAQQSCPSLWCGAPQQRFRNLKLSTGPWGPSKNSQTCLSKAKS